MKGNLAKTYRALGRFEQALILRRDVYSASLKLLGEDDKDTIMEANNYAVCLVSLRHFEKARSLLRRMMPVARRVHGKSHETTLRMRWNYAGALYEDDGATLGDLRKAVTTLEETERIARQVLGGAHPTTAGIEFSLQEAQAALRAREAG